MITIRCTARAARRLRVDPLPNASSGTGALGDWYMSVGTGEAEEIFFFFNERTLLTVAIPTNAPEPFHAFVVRLGDLLSRLGLPQEQIAAEMAEFRDIQIGRTENSAVVQLMKALTREYLERLPRMQQEQKSLADVEVELSSIPHSAMPRSPRELAVELLSSGLQGEAS